jgi:hypothetical protein
LIAGKYKTANEAVKGLRHLAEMTRSIRADRDRLMAERTTAPRPIEVASPPTREPIAELPISGKLDEVLAKIVEDGGTLDEDKVNSLRDAIREESRLAAQGVVSARDNESAKEAKMWNDVDSHMREKYPDSLRFTEEIALFKQTDALVGVAVDALISQGKAKEAAELAWTSYEKAVNAQVVAETRKDNEKKEITLEAAEAVRKEAVEQARKDAGVSATAAGGVHENPSAGVSHEELAALAAAMQRGDVGAAQRWRDLAFGQDLTGPLFD